MDWGTGSFEGSWPETDACGHEYRVYETQTYLTKRLAAATGVSVDAS